MEFNHCRPCACDSSCHRCGPAHSCCCCPVPAPPGFYFCLRITDCESGAPLPGAVLELNHTLYPQTQTAVSDAQGRACFCLRPCQSYRLTEQSPPEGYAPDPAAYTVYSDACGQILIDGRPVAAFEICNSKLVPELFSVTYDPNGGGGGFTDEGIPAGTSYTVLDETEASVYRFNYEFVSWNTAPDGSGVTYQPGGSITMAGNVTLYAQWREIPEEFYSVTYNANGGSGGAVISGLPSGALYPVMTDTQAGVSFPGQTFAGWNTMADGSGSVYMPGDTLVVFADVTLYAQWT